MGRKPAQEITGEHYGGTEGSKVITCTLIFNHPWSQNSLQIFKWQTNFFFVWFELVWFRSLSITAERVPPINSPRRCTTSKVSLSWLYLITCSSFFILWSHFFLQMWCKDALTGLLSELPFQMNSDPGRCNLLWVLGSRGRAGIWIGLSRELLSIESMYPW